MTNPDRDELVKLLVWGKSRITGEVGVMAQDAYTSIGHYIASDNGWFLQGQSGWNASASMDAAKAEAQLDYEDRVRSALVEVPAVKGEPVAADAGMREALAEIKLIALTAGAPGGLATHSALSRIVRLCRDAGITETMTEIRTALTAPGATTKSDGGDVSSLPSGESKPVVTQACPPSDPSSTRSGRWVCAARQRGITLDPQDCDWPVCGCDPLANKVLDTIAESGFVIVPKDGAPTTDDQIKHMVDRFLGWTLPENFNPDGGVSFKRLENRHHHPDASPFYPMPVGTNLFDAVQATAMVRHMLEGLPSTRSDVTVEAKHLVSSARAFLAHFDPCDLAEDKSQQWQSLEHQCNRVERALLDQFEIRSRRP